MKNKGWIIGLICILAVIGVGGYYINDYYQGRYVGSDYYAKVPANQGDKIEDIKDMSGKVVDKGFNYELEAYNEKGEKVTATFSIITEDVNKLFAPGTYLKISHSKTIVVGQEAITKNEVPVTVLPFIE